jgi:phosphate uptake regulator
MKRKTILMGGKTHVISLPLKWVKKYGVTKGQELNLEEKQNSIIVSTESKPKTKEIELNLKKADSSTIIKNIVSCYQLGYNFLNLKFNPTCINHKTGQEVPTNKIIEGTCNQLIGFEIVEQTENYIHLKDLTDNSINEFNNILRRTFLLLNTFGKETHKFLKTGKSEDLHQKHIQIRKYTNYCQRYLNIFGYDDKTTLYTELLFNLEEISRTYRFITKEQVKLKPQTLKMLKKTTLIQEDYYKLFYKFSHRKTSDIIKERIELFKQINTISKTLPKQDLIFIQRLPNILNAILSLINTSAAINFKKK